MLRENASSREERWSHRLSLITWPAPALDFRRDDAHSSLDISAGAAAARWRVYLLNVTLLNRRHVSAMSQRDESQNRDKVHASRNNTCAHFFLTYYSWLYLMKPHRTKRAFYFNLQCVRFIFYFIQQCVRRACDESRRRSKSKRTPNRSCSQTRRWPPRHLARRVTSFGNRKSFFLLGLLTCSCFSSARICGYEPRLLIVCLQSSVCSQCSWDFIDRTDLLALAALRLEPPPDGRCVCTGGRERTRHAGERERGKNKSRKLFYFSCRIFEAGHSDPEQT